MINKKSGFTLIELLIVIAIIVLLMAISIFGLAGARESARDQRRKSDLETVRSALEIFRSDCDRYPTNGEVTFGNGLSGPASIAKCSGNVYMTKLPTDPGSASYKYNQTGGGTGYEICSTLEKRGSGSTCGTGGSCSCGGTSCGSSTCYYKAVSP